MAPSFGWVGALATGLVVAMPLPALAANPASPVAARTAGGHEVIEIDMAALADPQPGRAAPAPAAVRNASTVSGLVTARPARKRYPHRVGAYEDLPMVALLASTN